MAIETSIEAVRNRKNQKLFIILDDTLEMRYKVVNTLGEIIILPDLLFHEDPVTVPPANFAEEFTPEQIAAFEQHVEKMAAQARLEASRPKPKVEPQRVEAAPAPKKRSSSPRKPKVTDHRRGLGAAWSSPCLTFYRHKIEPLADKQTFRVTVEGGDCYEISKADFMMNFNDVVMSPTYRAEGLFTYKEIPPKMLKYVRTVTTK